MKRPQQPFPPCTGSWEAWRISRNQHVRLNCSVFSPNRPAVSELRGLARAACTPRPFTHPCRPTKATWVIYTGLSSSAMFHNVLDILKPVWTFSKSTVIFSATNYMTRLDRIMRERHQCGICRWALHAGMLYDKLLCQESVLRPERFRQELRFNAGRAQKYQVFGTGETPPYNLCPGNRVSLPAPFPGNVKADKWRWYGGIGVSNNKSTSEVVGMVGFFFSLLFYHFFPGVEPGNF